MRIALVCPYDWSRPGGVQAHVAALARTLATSHDVTVVAPDSGQAADHAARDRDGEPALARVGPAVGLRFNRSVAPVAVSPAAARRTLVALRDVDPDVVHVHEPMTPWVALSASVLGPRPIVGTFHAWSDGARLYRELARPARRALGRLDARVAVSPAARDYAVQALGLPGEKVMVVPNGVDAGAFTDAEPLPELVAERPLLLFVGRLEARKGLEVAVRSWLRLRQRRPDVRLCVVGEGPERARCVRMVPDVARGDVTFVGRVSASELPRYHASADAFLAPALGGESFGIVLLEAMAAGLPVIASDLPGYRAVIGEEPAAAGLLVAPQDAEGLADAADRVLGDTDLRARLVRAGRAQAAAHDWSVVAGRLESLYGQVGRTGTSAA